MPDTQGYVATRSQPLGAVHLDLVTRWVCKFRERWREPSTGKQMPLAMLIHLGDMVQTGDKHLDRPKDQWPRIDAAFDRLDACGMPYLAAIGNHDLWPMDRYESPSRGFNRHFGVDRYAAHRCADPNACRSEAGEWFLGGGDTIRAGSRNRDGVAGPPTDQPGRHRAALIRSPAGVPVLFLGLDLAFDFPPAASPQEGDDAAWPLALLARHADAPTIVFHHSLVGPRGSFAPDHYGSDSYRTTRALWDRFVLPHSQVRAVFSGHWVKPEREASVTRQRPDGSRVHAFLRNYQWSGGYGNGWNAIAVFDPAAGELRVRSYRIEDVDNDHTHDGEPQEAALLKRDFREPERVLPLDFPRPGKPAD